MQLDLIIKGGIVVHLEHEPAPAGGHQVTYTSPMLPHAQSWHLAMPAP
jgi:hypothetical protein